MVIIIVYVTIRYIFPGNEHREFHEKIIKLYFNIWYIKYFYLLQKEIKLNIRNISVLIKIFINLYDNSNIDCNKKIKINYIIYIIILFLINSFIVINKKNNFLFGIINRSSLLLIHVRSSVILRSKELVFFVLLSVI